MMISIRVEHSDRLTFFPNTFRSLDITGRCTLQKQRSYKTDTQGELWDDIRSVIIIHPQTDTAINRRIANYDSFTKPRLKTREGKFNTVVQVSTNVHAMIGTKAWLVNILS